MRMRREGPRWMRNEAPGRDTRDDRGIEEEDGTRGRGRKRWENTRLRLVTGAVTA